MTIAVTMNRHRNRPKSGFAPNRGGLHYSVMLRAFRSLLFLLACALFAGCPRGIRVELQESGRAGEVVVVIGDTRTPAGRLQQVDLISVHTCASAERKLWWLVERPKGISDPVPTEVRYGVAPGGWLVQRAAVPLSTGCYEVSVVGEAGVSGGFIFLVDSSGIARGRT